MRYAYTRVIDQTHDTAHTLAIRDAFRNRRSYSIVGYGVIWSSLLWRYFRNRFN